MCSFVVILIILVNIIRFWISVVSEFGIFSFVLFFFGNLIKEVNVVICCMLIDKYFKYLLIYNRENFDYFLEVSLEL